MQIANAGNSDRRRFSAQALQLAQMLHDWDPIGVYEGDDPNPSADEYDDLVSPILTALRNSPDPTLLAGQLREVLSSDYGLSDVDDVDEFAEQVVAWSITQRGGSNL
ncbi:hypothetical protein [Lacisediminihabitans profunda]|uniref:DUF1871 family protein n=1 Tax=Lacisediminihabitans profunda TaxID=2594790 RepID=A0A5C8UJD2_9MICO|nr:hypothetical protein [Lacisediminihabitans profunda]TXN28154.1 hypothetical protein FVP33_18620 [Lacisediminihabitans profunda]